MTRWILRAGPWLGAAYPWAVVAAAAAAMAAALSTAVWPPARELALLCVAGTVASALRVPMPAGGYRTLRPAVAAAGIGLFGAPSAAVAMAVGAVFGDGALRQRPLRVVLFNSTQAILATLAAGSAAALVQPDFARWARPLPPLHESVDHALAILAAAAAFALVSSVLVSWYIALRRRRAFAGVLGANIGVEIINTFLLFGFGSIAGLVINGSLPLLALLVAVPVAMVSAVLMVSTGGRQASAELEALHDAALEVGRCETPEEMARVVAAAMDRLVISDTATIWLRRPGEFGASPIHGSGPGDGETVGQIEMAELVAEVMRSGRPVRSGNYERDRRRNPRLELLDGTGTVLSAMAVPMTAAGEIWGALVFADGERHHFTARHEYLVTTLAGHVAVAMRNAHQSDEGRRQAERLTALQHLGFAPSATLDVDEACRFLVRRSAEALGARYALLALYDGRRRELHGQAAYGTDEEELRRLRVGLDAEPGALREAVRALRERRSLVCAIGDDDQMPACRCPVLLALPEGRYALTAPMIHQGRPVGALTVVRSEPRPFSAAETAIVEATAVQGAAAVENARACAALKVRNDRLQAAVERFGRMGGAADLPAIFALVAEGARDLFGASRCMLLAWDGQGPVTETLGAGLSDESQRAVLARIQNGRSRYIAQSPRPHVMAGLPADPGGEPTRSAVLFPLRFNATFLGLMALIYDDEGGGISPDIEMAAAFADQVAAAMARMAKQVHGERRLDELVLLNRIVGSVNASLDPMEVCRIAASELAEAVGIARVTIHRLEGTMLRLVAQVGSPDAPAEAPVFSGISGRVARSGRPEFVASVRDDPDHVSGSPDTVSMAAVPVVLEGVTTGVLTAEGTSARPLTRHTYEFLAEFAGQLSIAVRNASLFEDLRRTHDELQVLFEAAKAVSGTLDLRTVLDSLVTVTCRAFGYENGALLLVEADTGDLVVEAAYGYHHPVVGVRVAVGTGISGWVARTGSPLMVDDVSQDLRYYQIDDRIRSEMAVPLIAEGKVLGVFNIESTRLSAFGPRDLHLLGTLASYAVVAIQNARLYEQAQRLAITDGLTELYNHRYFYEALERLLERARRDAQPLAIIMAEIDRFKHHNDTYGHKSGDEVLRTIAGLLRRGSRPSDIVARYGGDEFMVVLPGASGAAAYETAERLRRTVEAYPLLANGDVITSVTMSVGVAAFPQDGATANALVEAVDRAQYIAKRSGGNKVHASREA